MTAKRITSWNHMNISQSAKVIIINSILIGALMHYLAMFRIPSTIVSKLDRMIAVFFWKDNQGKGLHWKKHALIQTPRGQGGLGIRNIGIFNSALLMKKAWRVNQNPHLLLSRVYHRNNSPGHSLLRRFRQSSWGRNKIVMAADLLEHHNCWKVGNGRNIGVSSHRWMNGKQPTFRDHAPLYEARYLKVADLIQDNQRGWNLRKINRLFELSSARQIKSIELPSSPDSNDDQFWPYSKSG
ncbi:uncharacterized mitochondrial protein AtMg00310-like [Beta vulgaris subsp. vulgaris]|uniref:uncharacterized mitochondrial protein AtMg00310-like n=1 Tax=Beta vulgaris subsp. vulgaris TaxID=3555 RepID=UPI0009005B54|nr:uncharacterized mitochondrial protein AtMg00310-like [Beta vulgaris subsp. vulgaris]